MGTALGETYLEDTEKLTTMRTIVSQCPCRKKNDGHEIHLNKSGFASDHEWMQRIYHLESRWLALQNRWISRGPW